MKDDIEHRSISKNMVAKSSKPNLLDGRDDVGRRPRHMTAKLGVIVNEDCHTLLTLK